jgi:tetratricopeptide (TPR) repeat protein
LNRIKANVVSALLVAFLSPTLALAKEKEKSASESEALEKRAKEHYQQGSEFYAAKSYEEALAEFESAYLITPSEELEINIGYALWGLGRTEEAKKRFRHSYRHTKNPNIQASALSAMQELSSGDVGDDGLTSFTRKAAQISLLTAGSAAAVGLLTGGLALEQALIEGKQGFARPQGLINVTNVAFSVSVGAALVGAGILYTQHNVFSRPIKLFVSPTQASVAFQF